MSLIESSRGPLEGASLSDERFSVEETHGRFDGSAIFRVLTGETAVCHMHGVLAPHIYTAIRANFWDNPGRRPRPDKVPGYYVGGYHFGKSIDAYLRECEDTRPHVDALFHGVESPVEAFRNTLDSVSSSSGRALRRAEHEGRLAGECRALSWHAAGDFLLAPHDDIAQIGTEAQRGFEIQDVRQHIIVAVNLYISMPPSGGELRVWNILPNDSCRRRLGIEDRGHPYPPETLQGYDSKLISIQPGDCVLFNGALVHGVHGAGEHAPERPDDARLILTFFVGFQDERSVIWWT